VVTTLILPALAVVNIPSSEIKEKMSLFFMLSF